MAETTGAMIFGPWIDRIEALGGHFCAGHYVRDVTINSSGLVTHVIADTKEAGRKVCISCMAAEAADGRCGIAGPASMELN